MASRSVVVGWSRGGASRLGCCFCAVCGERVVDGGDGFVGGLGCEVAVGVGGCRQGGVAEGLGKDGEGDTGGDGDRGGQMAEVVNGGAGDTGLGGEAVEVGQDVFGVEWSAVGSVEDVAVGRLWFGGAGGVVGAVAECGFHAWGEGAPVFAAAGFGCGEDEAVVVDGGEGWRT